MSDLESSVVYWRLQLARWRASDPRPQSASPTVALINRLAPEDRVDFYNSVERIEAAGARGDMRSLLDMRNAVDGLASSDLRTLVLAALDAQLASGRASTAQRRHTTPGRRIVYEDRSTGTAVLALR